MNCSNDKERNERIDKLIRLLSKAGTTPDEKRSIEAFLADEKCHKKGQSEEDYQKEQAAWLSRVRKKKKDKK